MTARMMSTVMLLWIIVVAGTSTLTWMVISSAGARVGQTAVLATTSEATPAAPGPARASWSGAGGRLTANCSGDSVSLVTAVPAVGYWVKVYDSGPERLRVDFESMDPDDHAETRLVGTCVAGSPLFRRA